MQSTLFTTLTVTEEASLSGGWYDHKKKPVPVKPTPAPTPAPAKPTVSLSNITQVNVITDSKNAVALNNISIN